MEDSNNYRRYPKRVSFMRQHCHVALARFSIGGLVGGRRNDGQEVYLEVVSYLGTK